MTSILIRVHKNIFGSRKLFEKCNIFESMKPLYYVAKVYGLAPFQFRTNYPQNKGIDYFFVLLNFFCYLFVMYVIFTVESFYYHGTKCVDIAVKVFYLASSSVSMTTLIRMFFNRHRIRKTFEQLNEIDVEVKLTCYPSSTLA